MQKHPAFRFVFRQAMAWLLLCVLVGIGMLIMSRGSDRMFGFIMIITIFVVACAVVSAWSHAARVQFIAGRIDETMLSNRQRRQIEIPFDANTAATLVDAAIRELPGIRNVHTAHAGLFVRGEIKRKTLYERWGTYMGDTGISRVSATITPGDGSASVTLLCEPDSGIWDDFFNTDDGANLETAEALVRTITRRVGEMRRGELAGQRESAIEKELTAAKLGMLEAQVEPHFLYNTLASAQLLTRSDPKRADEMLGQLIVFLRGSVPKLADGFSTLGAEVERSRAYLEVLKIRMGSRLAVSIEMPGLLAPQPFPPMMLQTLVENAIKHGLEPKSGGGTIWIRAHATDGKLAVTVADDGAGLTQDTGGTGLGLKNVRERLKLAYADAASLTIAGNFPTGIVATINVPVNRT